MSARLELKIFLSSPGDVSDERGLARRVLDRLSQEYGLRDRVHLEEVSWDDPGAPVPLDAHLSPQEAINNRRPKPSQCDVVVVILWSRMGTPLPAEHRKVDGTPYGSGTEWEFCDAMEAAEKTGKPTVLIYRRSEKRQVDLDDAQLEEKRRQYKGVEGFFAQFTNTDGSLRHSYKPYASPSEFADKLERELRELIQVQLDALPEDAPAKDDTSAAAIASDATTKPIWEGNPYRGLNAFRERHAAIFFGRGRETDELIKRFAAPTTRIIAVIGASGSGKSSLVGAGTTTRYWWGDEVGTNNANCSGCGGEWDGKGTAPVDAFKPNPLGLYNTAGNVWEWVQDCWHENYEAAPSDGSRWGEKHSGGCAQRVVRGGSWSYEPRNVRSALRTGGAPDFRLNNLGFRLAQDLD